jgi:ABC-type multidrug transport system permease subunit
MQKNIFTSLLALQIMIVLLKTCGVEPISNWSSWAVWATLYVPIGLAIVGGLILKMRKTNESK